MLKPIAIVTLLTIGSFLLAEESPQESKELPQDEMFIIKSGKTYPLEGQIKNGRYHAPKNVFSCQAYDFGESTYITQDGLMDDAACVSFYNSVADFKKAEVLFVPGMENNNLEKNDLKKVFESFGLGVLKEVDNAQGIEVLKEEALGKNMFFAAISIEKMSVLKTSKGKHKASTRGYLLFQNKDKLVVLTNQKVTLPDQKHEPKKHIEKLKQEILEFKKTFEFGLIPASAIEMIKKRASEYEKTNNQ